MSKGLLGFLVALLLVLAGIVFPFLVPVISAELVKLNQCDIVNEVCNAKSAGILILATIVIIGFAIAVLATAEKRWRKTHGLEIFYDNDDEWCHHFNEKSVDGKDCYFTRLKIINNSKTSVNCNGYLSAIKDSNGSTTNSRWTKSDLGWERQTDDEVGSPIVIGPDGDYKYLDVVWVNKDEDIFKIRTNQSSQGVEVRRPRETYYFHIVISAEGFGTIKQWFRVDWHGDFSDFKMKRVRGMEISIPFLRHRLDRA